jgi:putative DNA primase/helicase
LREIFNDDDDLIAWLQAFLGYALTGSIDEQIFLFAFGLGANGKSVLLRVLGTIWGDYLRVIQPETLMLQTRTSSGPTPDLARLAGARLVLGSETEEGRALSEALVKQLTGGDMLTARELYGAPFEFRPAFKLILAGNHRPSVRGTDHGIWRRIRLLPFARRFAKEDQDPALADKLLAEADDILAWLVEGANRYLEHGLGHTPRQVVAATESYRTDEDLVGEWMTERTQSSSATQSAVLYADFQGWCARTGREPISIQSFGRRLAERGLVKERGRAGAIYHGVCLSGTLL